MEYGHSPHSEDAFINKLINNTLSDSAKNNFRNLVSDVAEVFHTNLDDLFAPIAYYETLVIAEARAGNLRVLHPDNGTDYQQGLVFSLEEPSEEPLKITIENNKEDVVLIRKIDGGITNFTINLPEELLKTGRYYWKLKSEDAWIIRTFFVNKHLMPKKKSA